MGQRAASASSGQALGSSCRRRGGDDAGSGTALRPKAPPLRQAAALELREDEGEPLHTESRERAIAGAYQPARGPEEQVDGVVRRDGEQRLLAPVCTVILVSQDRLPLVELGRRHRGQQGFYLGPRSRHCCCRRRGSLGCDR